MKQCPSCLRTYEDDAQKFCLQDGTPLVTPASPQTGATPFSSPPQPQRVQPQPQPQMPPPLYGGGQSGGSPPPYAPPPAAAPRKRKVWPWVLGIVAVLGIGFVALVGVGVYFASRYGQEIVRQTGETKTFVNSRANISDKLREHYIDFSFNYPATWALDPKAGRDASPNFVKIERNLEVDGKEFTLEQFAVGWFTGTGTRQGDRAIFPQLVEQLSTQFSQGFPEYQKVSEGEARVGSYDGYEFRFKSRARNTPKGDVDFWGRVVLVPNPGDRKGVALIMLASSLAPEIKRLEDVGVKGELPVILNSFRLGTSSAETQNDDRPVADASDNDASDGAGESASLSSAPTDKQEVQEQLEQLEDEWSEANIEGDKAAIERILADEYVGVAGDGTQQTKAQYLSSLKADESVQSQSFRNLNLTLGGNRATLSGLTDVKFANGTRRTFRFTDVFIWRDGRWQAVSSQASPVE